MRTELRRGEEKEVSGNGRGEGWIGKTKRENEREKQASKHIFIEERNTYEKWQVA